MTRRDRCHLIGKRANTLNHRQAAVAWYTLAMLLEEELGMMAQPKYKDVLRSIRKATIIGRNPLPIPKPTL
jgi:hypothetical protein